MANKQTKLVSLAAIRLNLGSQFARVNLLVAAKVAIQIEISPHLHLLLSASSLARGQSKWTRSGRERGRLMSSSNDQINFEPLHKMRVFILPELSIIRLHLNSATRPSSLMVRLFQMVQLLIDSLQSKPTWINNLFAQQRSQMINHFGLGARETLIILSSSTNFALSWLRLEEENMELKWGRAVH